MEGKKQAILNIFESCTVAEQKQLAMWMSDFSTSHLDRIQWSIIEQEVSTEEVGVEPPAKKKKYTKKKSTEPIRYVFEQRECHGNLVASHTNSNTETIPTTEGIKLIMSALNAPNAHNKKPLSGAVNCNCVLLCPFKSERERTDFRRDSMGGWQHSTKSRCRYNSTTYQKDKNGDLMVRRYSAWNDERPEFKRVEINVHRYVNGAEKSVPLFLLQYAVTEKPENTPSRFKTPVVNKYMVMEDASETSERDASVLADPEQLPRDKFVFKRRPCHGDRMGAHTVDAQWISKTNALKLILSALETPAIHNMETLTEMQCNCVFLCPFNSHLQRTQWKKDNMGLWNRSIKSIERFNSQTYDLDADGDLIVRRFTYWRTNRPNMKRQEISVMRLNTHTDEPVPLLLLQYVHSHSAGYTPGSDKTTTVVGVTDVPETVLIPSSSIAGAIEEDSVVIDCNSEPDPKSKFVFSESECHKGVMAAHATDQPITTIECLKLIMSALDHPQTHNTKPMLEVLDCNCVVLCPIASKKDRIGWLKDMFYRDWVKSVKKVSKFNSVTLMFDRDGDLEVWRNSYRPKSNPSYRRTIVFAEHCKEGGRVVPLMLIHYVNDGGYKLARNRPSIPADKENAAENNENVEPLVLQLYNLPTEQQGQDGTQSVDESEIPVAVQTAEETIEESAVEEFDVDQISKEESIN